MVEDPFHPKQTPINADTGGVYLFLLDGLNDNMASTGPILNGLSVISEAM